MKKAFDQTVRDIKREVNKKVLKVPSIEQKVLDATSNEPWGPHGTNLADIAQASRNYHECQMIMTIIWKRINDTGKNWRHVYKALTVLEYLVAHGADRIVDEIREHAYQISTLSDFQYIDSSGRDQGSNVRKKSQSLVSLVNDKERIQEIRQKASANRDKFRSTSGAGMYRPGSYSSMGGYDDDRYGSRDEDRNGYGREREWGDERNGRYGDSYGRDGSNHEERYSRDGYRDDDYQGRGRSVDDFNNGSRGRSSDRERERGYEDDGQYSSSRGSGAKADDHSQDGRRLDRKYSEQNLSAPPSYEEAVGEGRSPVHSERDGETSTAFAPKSSSPTAGTGHQATAASTPAAPAAAPPPVAAAAAPPAQSPPPATANKESDGFESFDEFDPRGSFSAAPTTSSSAEMDLLGSLSESFSSNSLAIVPTPTTTSEAGAFTNSSSGQAYVATLSATSNQQTFDDPFGDGPFRAIPSSEEFSAQPQSASYSSQSSEPTLPVAPNVEPVNNVGFGGLYPPTTHGAHNVPNFEVSSAGPQNPYQEMSTPNQDIDILADILPPSGPSPPIPSQTDFLAQTNQFPTQAGFPAQTGLPAAHGGFMAQASQLPSQTGFAAQAGQPSFVSSYTGQQGQPPSMPGFSVQGGQQPMPQPGFPSHGGQNGSLAGFPSQMGPVAQTGFLPPGSQPTQQPSANYYGSFQPQPGSTAPVPPMSQVTSTQAAQYNNSNFYQQFGSAAPVSSQIQSNTSLASQPSLTASTGALALVPQPAKEFQTKSTVWADTLNRGLVNLNISGPKTNPLSDIGIDFDALNRKEKRMEKPSATPVTSTVTMGKAMGSGSGIGRVGASALRAPPNLMMGSGMGIGMGGGPGVGPAVGGYGAVNQPMGVGIGMNMPVNMGQGFQMQQPAGFPPGSTMPGGYNPMMGRGGYGQKPYGSGYR